MSVQTKIKNLEKSRVEMNVEVPADIFESFRKEALEHIAEHIELPGFRKGKVPENILKEKVGEMAILEEMAQHAISKLYPEILREHNIDALGRPQVSITKIAAGNPLSFTLTTTVMPEITLPDYKAIAKKENEKKDEVTVTDKEIEDATIELRKMRARFELSKNLKEGEKMPEIDEKNLPEIDAEYLKELGNFKDIEDFKTRLKESLIKEKEYKAKEKKQIDTIEKVLEKTKLETPELIVEYELDKMMAQMEHDITRSGLEIEKYLQEIKKTREDFRKEWREQAEKRAKMQLILTKIADTEKLAPTPKEIETEVKKLAEHFKRSGETNFNEHGAHAYVASVLSNQKVFQFLEEQK